MEHAANEFTLETDFTKMPAFGKIFHRIEQILTPRYYSGKICGLGIKLGKEWVSEIYYLRKGDSCHVTNFYSWKLGKNASDDFRNKFGVSPGEYLVEEIIRSGIKRIEAFSLKSRTVRYIELLKKRGHVVETTGAISKFLSARFLGGGRATQFKFRFDVTPRGIESVKRRRVI